MLCIAFVLSMVLDKMSSELTPRIVGGEPADIKKFPYSAALVIHCGPSDAWNCGASIISQRTLLTAAHCLVCKTKARILVAVGNANRIKAPKIEAKDYKIHEAYNSTGHVVNDIGVILLEKNLVYSQQISRVVLATNLSYQVSAKVAGWGFTCELVPKCSEILMFVNQKVLDKKFCESHLSKPLNNTFCAGVLTSVNYPAAGDSGSALVVQDSIQIGLVSYRQANRKRLVVYTDTTRFFHWIWRSVYELHCRNFQKIGDDIKAFPYMASLTIKCVEIKPKSNRTIYCGASIITSRILLTAAHCLDCKSKASVMVSVGSANRLEGQKFRVKDFRIYDQFKPPRMENDIALLLLEKPLVFSGSVGRTELTSNTNHEGDSVVVGWGFSDGTTQNVSKKSDWLLFFKQQIMSKDSCQKVSRVPFSLCSSFSKTQPASGDAGNPLMIGKIQIGLIAYKMKNFIVYTHVSRYISWIKKTAEELLSIK